MDDWMNWRTNGHFMLLGPNDDLTPEWLAALLDRVGTPAEWAALGLPLSFNELGNVTGLQVHVVFGDDGPEAVQGAALEAARRDGDDIDSRTYSFALIDDEEARDLPRCADAGARAPW